MMYGETANASPVPGDGPAEWRDYVKYPIAVGVTMVSLGAVVGVVADYFANESAKTSGSLSAIRVTLTIFGLMAMGVAVWLRPKAVPILAGACACCLAARLGFPQSWDSGRILAGLLTSITGIGAVLMALPQTYRRIGVTLIILYHFGSIVAAVTSPATGNFGTPWLTQAASAYLFRPYSQSTYLINAYHFYSPDPGPASQVWFCISYDDGEVSKDGKRGEGSVRWHKLPRRPEDMTDPLALEYYRRLSLTQQMEQLQPFQSIPDEILRRRNQAAFGANGIAWHPELAPADQFRPPAEAVRLFLIPSYVRHVARLPMVQHDKKDPATDKPYAISKIKVYRVEHRILLPSQLQMAEPYFPNTYLPYYQGEYNADGTPTDPNDPMMSWLVPIFYQKKKEFADAPSFENPKTNPEKFELYDGIYQHTHSKHDAK